MIKSLSYTNALKNWVLEPLRLDRMTLLVGASGVGKTRILQALNGLRFIASGQSLPGRSWSCEIVDLEGREYLWEGGFEKSNSTLDESDFADHDDYDDQERTAKVAWERLSKGSDLIFERDLKTDRTDFRGREMPKLPSEQSLLATLKEEDAVKPVTDALQRIVLSQGSQVVSSERYLFAIYRPARLLKTVKTADDIRRSSLRVLEKLYLAQQIDTETFGRFKEQFTAVFPDIENVKIDQRLGAEEEPVVVVSIKERGVENWIEHENISSGMLRTLLHLSEILLLPDDSILLIDEFENSLGVNCIDVVTEEVLQASSRIQCVMTSHHPYVINNIGYEHWRVVTRKGSTVSTKLPSEMGIGRSSHDKFLQLINSRGFQGLE